MLNSAACRSKTVPATARSPYREKSSRGNGLTPGSKLRYRRAYDRSRNRIESIQQHIPSETHGSINWPYIATPKATCASDWESNRRAYDASLPVTVALLSRRRTQLPAYLAVSCLSRQVSAYGASRRWMKLEQTLGMTERLGTA